MNSPFLHLRSPFPQPRRSSISLPPAPAAAARSVADLPPPANLALEPGLPGASEENIWEKLGMILSKTGGKIWDIYANYVYW